MTHVATLFTANIQELSDIDARFGDGDHGITVGKIADLITAHIANVGDKSIKDFFGDLGTAIVNVKGGSAGPLYGTMIGGLGECLTGDETEIDATTLKAMFASMQEELGFISNAKVGDKTMMDSLIPAVEAAQGAPDDIAAIFAAATAAADAGCKASEGFVSKFGRARSYKEQTIGTPDAGAASTALFIKGLAQ
ncbi:DAK2 domain-containing protein [Bengtsoniella intestinalis]